MSLKRTILTHVLFPVLILTGCAAVFAQAEEDVVIGYYWSKASAAFEERNLCDLDLSYQVEAVVYYSDMNIEGRSISTDSTGLSYFCTGSTVDSQSISFGEGENLDRFRVNISDVFDLDHITFMYPNDTGGQWIPIGLDTKAGSLDPTGFITIDRTNGDLRWVYLYYPKSTEHRRLSRCHRVADFGGYMFPDSVWEVGARDGILGSENYRIEARVTSVELFQKTE